MAGVAGRSGLINDSRTGTDRSVSGGSVAPTWSAQRPIKAKGAGSAINETSVEHGTGCLVCSKDDDHANLLLCERCNDEYHTYCLRPALNSVPEGDWFCDLCKPFHLHEVSDGLNEMVTALSPSFTSRFGEIVWAQGGVGFGWWPACIYDPHLTVGSARHLAKKNVGKKHLVYFFECHEAPFAVMGNAKLYPWEEGLLEEYDIGKTARNAGKNRAIMFERALQAALVEISKPTAIRMEWNHHSSPTILSPPRFVNGKETQGIRTDALRGRRTEFDALTHEQSSSRSVRVGGNISLQRDGLGKSLVILNRTNAESCAGVQSLSGRASSEPTDIELYCKILKRHDVGGLESFSQTASNIGFVSLPSRHLATYADIRYVIETELDVGNLPQRWQFYIPKLGPMSIKQEVSLGPALSFLRSTTCDPRLGVGTPSDPLKIVLIEGNTEDIKE